ncbi:BTB/POZ domain-containing protein 6-A [Pseudolycoriella hygida]|uniref:BTB/POZ domain-containing protein 6-A n=1 Tax=Pseudolycoriella hygida TaxID=35572 RepID=A0A9Q0S226_9DIPT|nr:BTB/POZ domain-containing protein 6-A [Pseudolycoriella hygida]
MANILKNNTASDVISKLYLNEYLADVHFQFNNDDDIQKVPANKFILAAVSPVFDAMFFGSLKEGNIVKIIDADVDSFKEFLQFFYLDKVTLTMENIETVARLAVKYNVLEYINACVTFLKTQLTIDSMCWGYQLGVFLKNEELIKFCEDKIGRSPMKVFAGNGFQRCDKSTLKRILNLNLNCREADVFAACLLWAKYSCKQNGLDEMQAENLKTQLGDCLHLIRIGAMTLDEFSAYEMNFVFVWGLVSQAHRYRAPMILNDGLFTPAEFIDAMLLLTVRNYQPEIFNQKPRSLIWNEKEILKCARVSCNTPTRYVEKSEVVWFKSNQRVILGGFETAHTYHTSHISPSDEDIGISIAEIDENSTKKVLYNGQSNVSHGPIQKVILTQQFLIEPQTMYEIQLTVSLTSRNSYYLAEWCPTVNLGNGHIIQFHRNPAHTIYDTCTTEGTFHLMRHITNGSADIQARVVRDTDDMTPHFLDKHHEAVIIDLNCNNTSKILGKDTNTKIKYLFEDIPILPMSQVFYISRESNQRKFSVKQVYRMGTNEPLVVEENVIEDSATALTPTLRRRNLQGFRLKASLVVTNNDSLNHLNDYRDVHIDALSKVTYILTKELMRFVNATVKYNILSTWGYKDKTTGKWNGVVGQLISNEADVGASPLFFIAERVSLVEYISRPTSADGGFIFRAPKLSYTNNIFLLPFDRFLWMCLCGLVLLIAMFLGGTVFIESKIVKSEIECRTNDVYMIVWGAMCQQGSSVTPTGSTGRIVMAITFIILMFLFVSYSANIVALLQSSSNKIRTLQDLYESKIDASVEDAIYTRHYFPGQNAFFTEFASAYKVISETFMDIEKCGLQEMRFFEMKTSP